MPRPLRSTAALVALLVTAGSNLTAFQCNAPSSAGGDAHADAHGSHHGASEPETSEGRDGPRAGDVGLECAVLMACGAVLRGMAAGTVEAELAPRLDDAPFAAIEKPSAADLSQDPPPPRRHA